MKIARLHVRGRDTGVAVSITETARERLRGLLDHERLAPDAALLLERCASVHTFGMRFAIDVVFLDRHRRIVAIHRDVPRRRMLFNLRASRTLEMPADGARRHGLSIGDPLVFEAAS
ncbi:DUF192 domain-containing protein [Paraburkholderia ginsengisoli]|uniref:DUF192 domain-containing protein n=1 Tax=Paraburkholderia ginsengisoli TaxID=311231 RepID=A0A7T4TBN9_9BURK|nr:DUF192 domain-containing protein [Paraburkholderia ginsengisoli]QQC66723.1 DUF192 domain-containing protein [Paraburkholderia ginsengisoli]